MVNLTLLPKVASSTSIPNDVIQYLMPHLTGSAFKLYCALLYAQARQGTEVITISYAELRRISGVGKSQAYSLIWLMEADRLIDIERSADNENGTAPNRYHILPVPAEFKCDQQRTGVR